MATDAFENGSIYSCLPGNTSMRLLSFLSRQDESIIRCSLLTINDLNTAPPYDALSYTWDDPIADFSDSSRNHSQTHEAEAKDSGCGKRLTIFCNGREILVKSNLRNALQMLLKRHGIASSGTPSGGSNLVWIDQLCINQGDKEEKSLQVAMMGEIFSKAQTVFAWTGEGDETTADALTVVDRLSSIPANHPKKVNQDDFTDPMAYESKLGITALGVSHWLGWLMFLHNSYFKRVWIVQEVCLSNNVVLVVGKDMLAWAKFSSALSFLITSGWLPLLHTEYLRNKLADGTVPERYRKILSMNVDSGYSALYLNQTKTNAVAAGRLFSLEALLRNHRGCKAKDPVDKVYALLGVSAKDRKPFTTHPGALTPKLFSHIEARPLFTKVEDLPSWVPDFSVPLLPSPLSYRQSSWNIGDCVTWKRGSREFNDSLLDIRGICVGSVSQTSLSMLKVQNTPLFLNNPSQEQNPTAEHLVSLDEYWSGLCGVALGLDPYYSITPDSQIPQTRVEVLWRTLIMDTYLGQSPAPPACGEQFLSSIASMCRTMLREEREHEEALVASRGYFRRLVSQLRLRSRMRSGKAAYAHPNVGPWMNLIDSEPAESMYNGEAFTRCAEAVTASGKNPEIRTMADYTRPFEQYRLEMNLSVGHRKLFRTDNDLLGYGPDALRETDEIWILGGAKVPFALRRVAGKPGHYQLLGESYVHGIMFGNATQHFDTVPCDIVLE